MERLTGKGGDAYPHIDWNTEEMSGNSWWGYDGDRFRIQVNSSPSIDTVLGCCWMFLICLMQKQLLPKKI